LGGALLLKSIAERVKANVGKVIVGKEKAVELALVAILCEGHVLIEDVPGIGKTTLAKALARSLNLSFKRIQFTPDLLPSDVTGLYFFNQKTEDFEFRLGPIMANIVLADEINRATPRTQSALLEAMTEFFLLLLFYLLGYAAWLLMNLIPSLPWRGSKVATFPPPSLAEIFRETPSSYGWPPLVGTFFRGVFVMALAAFFLRMLFKAFGRAEAPLVEETWESRESVASLAELRRWWEALFTKLRKRLEKASERGYAPAELLRKPSSALAIRMIYRELLRLMAEFGFPRRPWETPYEYLKVLEEAFPSVRTELGFITEAYVMARYGADFPSLDMLMEVRRNWEKAIEVFSGWHENVCTALQHAGRDVPLKREFPQVKGTNVPACYKMEEG
jgi:hypothetical protein